MAEKLILSTVSAWQLGEQFETTVAQKNDALREARIAKQDGDLSENAPYQAAKEKFRTMGRIQRRLTREMNQLLAQGHRLVDPLSWCSGPVPDRIEIGALVVVKMNEKSHLLAGARDHLPAEGISSRSPTPPRLAERCSTGPKATDSRLTSMGPLNRSK